MSNQTREAIAELLVRLQNLESHVVILRDQVKQQQDDIELLNRRTGG